MVEEVQAAAAPGSYANPRKWGDPGNRGDVYQVTQADADNNGIYAAGEFFIAQRDFPNGTPYFPGNYTDDANWKHAWTSVVTINIQAQDGRDEGRLFKNGQNQLPVVINVQAQDDNGTDIPVSPAEIARASKLVYFTDPNIELSSGPSDSQWYYTNVQNMFSTVPAGRDFNPANGRTCVLYIMARATSTPNTNMSVSVKLRLANANTYNTSFGSAFVSKVLISGLPPINYSTANTRQWSQYHGIDDNNGYTNRYLAPSDASSRFIKSETWGYTTSSDCTNRSICERTFYWGNGRLNFIWDIDAHSSQRIAGKGGSSGLTVTINDIPGALNVTTTWQLHKGWPDRFWHFDNWFIVYDQYGNSGKFHPDHGVMDDFHFLDGPL